MGINMYSGILNYKYLKGKAKTAYIAYSGQKQRCSNKNHPKFYTYGAKGIKVIYSAREFISWFIENTKNIKLNEISVGRIDHSKDYSFDNIEIQTRSENSKERMRRSGNPRPYPIKRIAVYKYKDMKLIKIVSDGLEASKITGVSHCNICGYCKGLYKKSRNGFTFRYHEEKK